jgi:hypothetical protein
MRGNARIPSPGFEKGDWAFYIGPICPNAYGRRPRRGRCRIVAAPHDSGHRAGLWFIITFQSPPSPRTEFRAYLSELVPVPDWSGGRITAAAAG